MFSVCFAYTAVENYRHQWEYVISHWMPDHLYVYGKKDSDKDLDGLVLKKAVLINGLADLPDDQKIVLLAPLSAEHVSGCESLVSFSHPEDAVYVFGSDSKHMEREFIAERQPDHKVFVPTDSRDQMFSFTACAVTLYDRMLKIYHGNR